MVVGDTLTIPVTITNLATSQQTVTIREISQDKSLKISVPSKAIKESADKTAKTSITINALSLNDNASINLIATSTLGSVVHESKVEKNLNIVNKGGIENSFSTGGYIGPAKKDKNIPSTAEFSYNLPVSMIDGSSTISAKIYSSNLAIFDETIEALMREV